MSRDAVTNPSIDRDEHDYKNDAKKATLWGYDAATDTSFRLGGLGKFVTEYYDYVSLSPDSSRPTAVTYKSGGSGGVTVATLTIAYDGTTSNITSVTRS